MKYKHVFAFLLFVFTSFAFAQKPVTITGFTGDGQQWASDVKENLKTIRKLTEEGVKPDIAELVDMARKSKEIYQLMAQKIALEDYGKLLKKYPGGQVTASDSNSLNYDGKNFNGGNYSYIDNLTNVKGLPLSTDRELPTAIQPLTSSQSKALSSLQGNLQNTLLNNVQTAASVALNNPQNAIQRLGLLYGSGSGYPTQAATQLATSSVKSAVADGVYYRPYQSGMDDYYTYAMGSGNAAQITALNIARNSSGYSPLVGTVSSLANQNSNINMNNIISNGASAAVDTYLTTSGSSASNPYANYAVSLTPTVLNLVNSSQVGQPLAVSASDVSAAKSGSSNIPSGIVTNPSSVAGSLFSGTGSSGSSSSGSGSSGAGNSAKQMVAVLTPTSDMSSKRQTEIGTNDKRIQENWQKNKKTEAMLDYTKQLLDQLYKLMDQAQEIRAKGATDPKYAVPEITTIMRDLQGEISRQQQFAYKLEQKIEELTQSRHGLLNERQSIVDKYDNAFKSTSSSQLSKAVAAGGN